MEIEKNYENGESNNHFTRNSHSKFKYARIKLFEKGSLFRLIKKITSKITALKKTKPAQINCSLWNVQRLFTLKARIANEFVGLR